MATSDGTGRPQDQRLRDQATGNGGQPTRGAAGKAGEETVAHSGPRLGLPEHFGRYHVKKKLGGGGMGAVYLVDNTELEREEALKVPHFEVGDDPEVRERFLREARSAAKLDHPNLCPVHDVGVLDGVYYLTMRYLKGKELTEYTGVPQPPRKAAEIVAKLAQALACAHAKGVIHRDLKPSNVMMCPGVGPVVMDFGLAKQTLRTQDQNLTQSGTMMGTPAYMPPEQVKGDLDQIGPASDVYSLGVILYELLTGRLPFMAKTAEVYAKILYEEAAPPSSLRPGLNPTLDAICAKAMAKEPGNRFPSMKAFAAALADYLRSTPPTEGAGNLIPARASPAIAMQAPTVGPGHAAVSTPSPRAKAPAPTRQEARPPSSVRKPAGTHRPAAARAEEEERGGLSLGAVIGWTLCVLLILGGLGGVGALVYLLNQKKAVPTGEVAAATTPVSAPEIEKATVPAKTVAPKDDVPLIDPLKNPPRADPPKTTPAPADAPAVDPPKTDLPPKAGPPPVSDPPKADPPKTVPPKADPPKVDPPKPAVPAAPKPDEPDPSSLLNEDFRSVDVGGRPKGWEGDAFAVQKEDDVPCLEVTNETAEVYYVKLPRMFIKGDFVLDAEFRLGYLQEFHMELRSRSSTPLPIAVDWLGVVKLETAQKETKGFTRYENVRFRLTRKGDVYNVRINDEVTVGKTIPDKGAFEEIRIGLTGGKGVIRARLYSVRITSLEKEVARPAAADPLPGINEDFGKATAGALPDGWTASKAANLAVQKSGANSDLELVNPALGGDIVQLPRVDLKGDFFADVAAAYTDDDTAVDLFFKGVKSRPLAIEMAYGGAITVAGLPKIDGSKAWVRGATNVLRLERSGKDKGYLIKLNNTPVGAIPLALAPGPFTEVNLAITIKTAKLRSPHVASVQVVPLEEASP